MRKFSTPEAIRIAEICEVGLRRFRCGPGRIERTLRRQDAQSELMRDSHHTSTIFSVLLHYY